MERETRVRLMLIAAAAFFVVFTWIPWDEPAPVQIYQVHVENNYTATAAPKSSAADQAGEKGSAGEKSTAGEESGSIRDVLLEKSIDINRADEETLARLPGIGPALARRIVEYRENNNGFLDIEEIMDVEGIGEKLFDKIEPYILTE